MSDYKKLIQVLLLLGIIAVGLRVFFIWRERREPAVVPHAAEDAGGYHPTTDDYTYLRQIHPEVPKDFDVLLGKTIWTNASDQLPYFPVTGSHVDYAHQVGVLRGATPLAVGAVLQQAPPRSLNTRVPNGDKQVLLAFKLSNDGKIYAVPAGYHDASGWTFIADQAFFYDDPHSLYSWNTKQWQAIESHTAIPGMTEQQVGLALGQVQTSDSQTMGDRTVHYLNLGNPVDVTFVKNHATTVTPVKSANP